MKTGKILCALIIAATLFSISACNGNAEVGETYVTENTTKKTEETVISEETTGKATDIEVEVTSESEEGTTEETIVEPVPTSSQADGVSDEDEYENSPMDIEYVKNKMVIDPVDGTEYEDIEKLGEKYGFHIVEQEFDSYYVKTNDPLTYDELNELSLKIDAEDIVEGCYLEFKATFG